MSFFLFVLLIVSGVITDEHAMSDTENGGRQRSIVVTH